MGISTAVAAWAEATEARDGECTPVACAPSKSSTSPGEGGQGDGRDEPPGIRVGNAREGERGGAKRTQRNAQGDGRDGGRGDPGRKGWPGLSACATTRADGEGRCG